MQSILHPSDKNSMRTATSKFVTVFDVFVVVGACICGAVTGLVGQKFIQRINVNLRKVTIDLKIENEKKIHFLNGIEQKNFRLTKNLQYLMIRKKIKDEISSWF